MPKEGWQWLMFSANARKNFIQTIKNVIIIILRHKKVNIKGSDRLCKVVELSMQ